MNLDLIKLKNGLTDKLDIDISYSFSPDELSGTDIISMNDISIKGELTKELADNYYLYLTVSGIMVLPCALTLKPVNHKFSIEINDRLDKILEEIGQNDKKDEFTLDIFQIVWENILMEIPMRVVSEESSDVVQEGEGWKLITKAESNTPLEQLGDLFKKEVN